MDQDRNIVQETGDIQDLPRNPLEKKPLDIDSSKRAHMKRVYSENQWALINKNRTTFRKAIKHANSNVQKIFS